MHRLVLHAPALLCLACLVGTPGIHPAHAEGELPEAVGAVQAALDAYKRRDRAALKRIAESDEQDPWLIAHELCLRGALVEARALATASARRDLSSLKRYVGKLARRRPPPIDAWLLRADVAKLGAAQKWFDLVERVAAGSPDVTAREIGAIDTVRMQAFALLQLDRARDAAEAFWRAGAAAEKIGWWKGASRSYDGCFDASHRTRDFQRMIECKQRAFTIFGRTGDREDAGRALADLGSVHGNLADYPQAIEHFEPVLAEYADALPADVRIVLRVNLALAFLKMGQYAEAERALHRARTAAAEPRFVRSDPAQARELDAFASSVLGMLRTELGEFEEAGRLLTAVLAHHKRTGDLGGQAAARGSLAELAEAEGNLDLARTRYGESLELFEETEQRAFAARAREGMASIDRKQGKLDRAIRELKKILREKQELNDPEALCIVHGELSLAYRAQGDQQRALAQRTENLALAREAASVKLEAASLTELARLHLDRKDYGAALARAREAEGVIGLIFDRLAPGRAARARESIADTYDVGLMAAVLQARATPGVERSAAEQQRRLEEVFFWLEGGRAGALLVALEGRASIREVAIDARLRGVEDKARTDEAIARQQFLDAKEQTRRAVIKKARERLEATRLSLKNAIERIQLEAGLAADLLYPSARGMREIQALLGEGDALVLYGSFGETSRTATALVVEKTDARIVELGPEADINTSCRDVRDAMTHGADDAVAAVLRDQVVAPLHLRGTVTRVLLSPAGALSYQPPTLLFPKRDVVCVPSGSTYARLVSAPRASNGRVLAIADPAYGAAPGRWRGTSAERGGALIRLPGTRKEAEAITPLHLLGEQATESGLRAALEKLAKTGSRLRALHFACHGLVDDERPGLSALALTPTTEDDGMLTVLDISQLRIPADLVVLSACESGLGRLYRAEGISSLSRAFMVAGASQVLVSLWNVDDEATRALMVRFYAHWNAKDPEQRVSAASALREAQAFVRAQPDWVHPRYWAAWQLWGS